MKSFAIGLTASLCFALAGCGASPDQGAPIVELAGERLSITSASEEALTGVFVREGESLRFSVKASQGASELSLASASGELLYFTHSSEDGLEMRVGDAFRSFLPKGTGPSAPWDRNASPVGFEVHGELPRALDGLRKTSFTLLPYLSAALGRAGYDGGHSRLGRIVHLAAMQFADQGFGMNGEVVEITNRTVTGDAAVSQPEDGLGKVSSTLSPDYSKTSRCNSGVARQFFGTSLDGDPCRDQCFGMCGPGCTPWNWLCGDKAVHATCWQHDGAYCPSSLQTVFGFSVPNPSYPACMAEYAAYSAFIAAETQAGFCEDNSAPSLLLWRSHPGFYTEYAHYTSTTPGGSAQAPVTRGFPVFIGGVASQSSDLPGYAGYAHGAAQARDKVKVADGSYDGNFFNGTTIHTDAGFVPDYMVPTSSPYAGQYWMLDMGALKEIGSLEIATRTDYMPGPLQDIVVLTWVGNGSVGWKVVGDAAGAQLSSGNKEVLSLPVGTISRYVLIQKKNASPLYLAEVTVFAGSAE